MPFLPDKRLKCLRLLFGTLLLGREEGEWSVCVSVISPFFIYT